MKNIFLIMLFFTTSVFSQDEKAPQIEVIPTLFDMGKVVEGTVVSKEYVIKNNGNDTLKIDKIRASCGCTAANPKKTILLPGEETTLDVSFNTANRHGKQKKHVYIFSNDPKYSEYRFTFFAEVVSTNEDDASMISVPKLKLDRYTYDFGKTKEGELLKLTVNFENTGKEILKIDDVKYSCGCTVASLSSKELKPGEKGDLNIELDTSDRTGKLARTITLYSNDPQNPRQTVTLFVNILEKNS